MSWRRICAADSVAEKTLKKFEVDGIPVIIANYGEGFRAFPPICPHMEEPLEESGFIEGKVLTCSKHLWQWDLSTKEMAGSETEKPMHFYDVKEEGGPAAKVARDDPSRVINRLPFCSTAVNHCNSLIIKFSTTG